MLLIHKAKFKPGDTVKTIGSNSVSGEVLDVRQVGCIYQVGVQTSYGRSLFRENELEMCKRGAKPVVVPVELSKEKEVPLPVQAPLPKKTKINYLEWYQELTGEDLKAKHPDYNNGQLAMLAKRLVAAKFPEINNLEIPYASSNTSKKLQK